VASLAFKQRNPDSMSPTLNVLLMSPLAGLDPICGDIIYTEQLLQNPPAGVKYQTYAEAMEQGNLVEISVRNNFAKAPLLSLANSALKIGIAESWCL
jgi:hypothetical protein